MTKAKDEAAADKTDEGTRGFDAFLRHIDDGVLHADASKELHDLAAKLHDYVGAHGGIAKGSLILTISLAALANGTVDVVADVKTKEPKPKRARSVFWLTKGNNLSPENPRQQKLPLREVPAAPKDKPRDVAADGAPRSI
jgi:hypothetical protein